MGVMKMKLKKRRILKSAIEQTEKPLWFVKYVLSDGTDGVLEVFADSHKKALKIAEKKLNEKDTDWIIVDTSCL
jgi:hypothetical protein